MEGKEGNDFRGEMQNLSLQLLGFAPESSLSALLCVGECAAVKLVSL